MVQFIFSAALPFILAGSTTANIGFYPKEEKVTCTSFPRSDHNMSSYWYVYVHSSTSCDSDAIVDVAAYLSSLFFFAGMQCRIVTLA